MKVGIIVHSHTGNTLSVAEKIKNAMTSKGHTVSIEQVSALNDNPAPNEAVKLKDIPDAQGYDVLLFGAPVRAFSLSAVMKAYLAQLSSLDGIKVGCFVTEQFPFAWMGGNNAIGQMKKSCSAKGAIPEKTGVVNWGSKKREDKIANVIATFSCI